MTDLSAPTISSNTRRTTDNTGPERTLVIEALSIARHRVSVASTSKAYIEKASGERGISLGETWSVEMFVHFADPAVGLQLVSKCQSGQEAILLSCSRSNDGTVRFGDSGGEAPVDSPNATDQQLGWHHLCLTWDGTNAIAYWDGQEKRRFDSAHFQGTQQRTHALSVKGAFADLRIWNRALRPAEVRLNATLPALVGSESGLVASFSQLRNGEVWSTDDRHCLHVPTLGERLTSAAVVDLASHPVTLGAAWTLEAQVRFPISTSQTWHTLARGPSAEHHLLVYGPLGQLGHFSATFQSADQQDIATVCPAGWHHLAVRRRNDKLTFFIDGKPWGNELSVSGTSESIDKIGNYDGTQPIGPMRKVRVWNVARTDEQIRQTVGDDAAIPRTDLLLELPLDERTAKARDTVSSREYELQCDPSTTEAPTFFGFEERNWVPSLTPVSAELARAYWKEIAQRVQEIAAARANAAAADASRRATERAQRIKQNASDQRKARNAAEVDASWKTLRDAMANLASSTVALKNVSLTREGAALTLGSTWTIELFVFDTGTSGSLVRIESTNGPALSVERNASGISVKLGPQSIAVQSGQTSGSNWVHVGVTYAEKTITAYIDGQPIGTAAVSSSLSAMDRVIGSLADLRVWSRALSGAEILLHSRLLALTGFEDGLRAIFPFVADDALWSIDQTIRLRGVPKQPDSFSGGASSLLEGDAIATLVKDRNAALKALMRKRAAAQAKWDTRNADASTLRLDRAIGADSGVHVDLVNVEDDLPVLYSSQPGQKLRFVLTHGNSDPLLIKANDKLELRFRPGALRRDNDGLAQGAPKFKIDFDKPVAGWTCTDNAFDSALGGDELRIIQFVYRGAICSDGSDLTMTWKGFTPTAEWGARALRVQVSWSLNGGLEVGARQLHLSIVSSSQRALQARFLAHQEEMEKLRLALTQKHDAHAGQLDELADLVAGMRDTDGPIEAYIEGDAAILVGPGTSYANSLTIRMHNAGAHDLTISDLAVSLGTKAQWWSVFHGCMTETATYAWKDFDGGTVGASASVGSKNVVCQKGKHLTLEITLQTQRGPGLARLDIAYTGKMTLGDGQTKEVSDILRLDIECRNFVVRAKDTLFQGDILVQHAHKLALSSGARGSSEVLELRVDPQMSIHGGGLEIGMAGSELTVKNEQSTNILTANAQKTNIPALESRGAIQTQSLRSTGSITAKTLLAETEISGSSVQGFLVDIDPSSEPLEVWEDIPSGGKQIPAGERIELVRPWTVEALFTGPLTGTEMYRTLLRDAAGNHLILTQNGKVGFFLAGGVMNLTTVDLSTCDARTHHLVVVATNSKFMVYLDDRFQAEIDATGLPATSQIEWVGGYDHSQTFPNLERVTVGSGERKRHRRSLLPEDSVVMWSGSPAQVPHGWFLCDGGTITKGNETKTLPDLRDKFVKGTGGTPGQTGGQSTMALTTDHLPAHSHEFDDVYFSESGVKAEEKYKNKVINVPGNYGSRGGGDEDNQGLARTSQTTMTGRGQSFSIEPPYYTLCFIIYKPGWSRR